MDSLLQWREQVRGLFWNKKIKQKIVDIGERLVHGLSGSCYSYPWVGDFLHVPGETLALGSIVMRAAGGG